MSFNFRDLEKLYIEAVESYAEELVEADVEDMDSLTEPSIMLMIDNPVPRDGSEVEVLPGLFGVVACTTIVEDGDGRSISAVVSVKADDVERFLKGIGMKLKEREEIIVEKLKRLVH